MINNTHKITPTNDIYVYIGTYKYSDEIDIVHCSNDILVDRNNNKADYDVRTLCKCLNIHHSVYYYHCNHKENSYEIANQKLDEKIKEEYNLNGLTIRCFALLDKIKTTSCLSFGLLNEKNIVALSLSFDDFQYISDKNFCRRKNLLSYGRYC